MQTPAPTLPGSSPTHGNGKPGPVPIDPHLFAQVAGGSPRGGWITSAEVQSPRGGWNTSTEVQSPRGGW